MSDGRTDRSGKWLLGILLFAAVTRLLYFLSFKATDPFFAHLLPDAENYHRWAAAIAQGKVFWDGPFYQAPLYPYLMGLVYFLFGPHPTLIYLLQSASGLVLILLVHRIARRAYTDRSALVAAALAALYGVFLFQETRLIPGAVTTVLAALAIDRMQIADASPRFVHGLLAGAIVGVSALANAGALLLIPLYAALPAFHPGLGWLQRTRRSAALLLGALAVILPVTIRNAVVGGDRVLVAATGGFTFYMGNTPGSIGLYDAPPEFSGSIYDQRRVSRELAEKEAQRPLRDSEVSSYWFGKGVETIRANPADFLVLLTRKAGLALDNYEHPLEYNPQLDSNPIRFLVPVPFVLIFALAAMRPFTGPKLARAELPLLLQLLAQAAVLLAFFVCGRYRLPAMPALIAIAGHGGAAFWSTARRSPRRALVPAAAGIVAALFSLFHTPLRFPKLQERQDAMTLCDKAGAYFLTGNLPQSVALYQQAIRTYPYYEHAYVLLARALVATGDRAQAEEALKTCLRIAPDLSEAHYELGVIRYQKGEMAEAAGSFEKAFRGDPRNAHAGNNLIGTLLKIGQYEQAILAWRAMKDTGLPVDRPLESWMLQNSGAGGRGP